MVQTFFSHGKLLITGEYVVLDGALGLAIPTKFGQRMEIEFVPSEGSEATIAWYSIDSEGETWFREEFLIVGDTSKNRHVKTHAIDVCNLNPISDKLLDILNKAIELNSDFLAGGSFVVKTYLGFPNNWGLGSSSTLICNIAKWAEVDAFILSDSSFGGSGYDIAVGMLGGDVLYRSPSLWEGYVYTPPFASQLYFIHLNQKQNSREGIASYRRKQHNPDLISSISQITEELSSCSDFDQFQLLINRHEKLISDHLGIPTIKELHFKDYPFAIKSLGAWGGDFILACGDISTPNYFKSKGYNTALTYSQLAK